MPKRQRKRSITYTVSGGCYSSTTKLTELREVIDEIPADGKNHSCVHRKMLSAAYGVSHIQCGKPTIFNGNPIGGALAPIPGSLQDLIEDTFISQLAGDLENNDFELLNFAAEIDDTLAMFSTKFLKELSYGSVTWGVLPFISDIKAALQSIQDLNSAFSGSQSSKKKIKRIKSFSWEIPYDPLRGNQLSSIWNASGTISTIGYQTCDKLDLSKPINKGLLLLDELGVHPDLKTAWDLIPLSFVVDYFIPVGSLLESLHPRGWGSVKYSFDGFQTVKFTYNMARSGTHATCFYLPALWQYYERRRRVGYTAPLPNPWSAPSLKEIFNVAYLSTALNKLF